MVEDRHTRQIVERCEIAGHDGALRCACCRSNDEVVGTAWAADLTYGDEQFGVFGSDRSVVGEDRDDVAHVVDERWRCVRRRPVAKRAPTWSSATVIAAIATSSSSPIAWSS
jgi:hypothetical protein